VQVGTEELPEAVLIAKTQIQEGRGPVPPVKGGLTVPPERPHQACQAMSKEVPAPATGPGDTREELVDARLEITILAMTENVGFANTTNRRVQAQQIGQPRAAALVVSDDENEFPSEGVHAPQSF
jgi:hypothetical protein